MSHPKLSITSNALKPPLTEPGSLTKSQAALTQKKQSKMEEDKKSLQKFKQQQKQKRKPNLSISIIHSSHSNSPNNINLNVNNKYETSDSLSNNDIRSKHGQVKELGRCQSNHSIISDLELVELETQSDRKVKQVAGEQRLMIKICDGLYIGAEYSIWDTQTMYANYITHMITLQSSQISSSNQSQRFVPEIVSYIHSINYPFNPNSDNQSSQSEYYQRLDNILDIYNKINQFVQHAHEEGQSCILLTRTVPTQTNYNIYGNDAYMFIYEAAIVATGYLMFRYKWSFLKALQFISSRLSAGQKTSQTLKKLSQSLLQHPTPHPHPLQSHILPHLPPASSHQPIISKLQCRSLIKLEQKLLQISKLSYGWYNTYYESKFEEQEIVLVNTFKNCNDDARDTYCGLLGVQNRNKHAKSMNNIRDLGMANGSNRHSLKLLNQNSSQTLLKQKMVERQNAQNARRKSSKTETAEPTQTNTQKQGIQLRQNKRNQSENRLKINVSVNLRQRSKQKEENGRKVKNRNMNKRVYWASVLTTQLDENQFVNNSLKVNIESKQKFAPLEQYIKTLTETYKIDKNDDKRVQKVQSIANKNKQINNDRKAQKWKDLTKSQNLSVINHTQAKQQHNNVKQKSKQYEGRSNGRNKIVVDVISIMHDRARLTERNRQANETATHELPNKKHKMNISRAKLPTLQQLLSTKQQHQAEPKTKQQQKCKTLTNIESQHQQQAEQMKKYNVFHNMTLTEGNDTECSEVKTYSKSGSLLKIINEVRDEYEKENCQQGNFVEGGGQNREERESEGFESSSKGMRQKIMESLKKMKGKTTNSSTKISYKSQNMEKQKQKSIRSSIKMDKKNTSLKW